MSLFTLARVVDSSVYSTALFFAVRELLSVPLNRYHCYERKNGSYVFELDDIKTQVEVKPEWSLNPSYIRNCERHGIDPGPADWESSLGLRTRYLGVVGDHDLLSVKRLHNSVINGLLVQRLATQLWVRNGVDHSWRINDVPYYDCAPNQNKRTPIEPSTGIHLLI